MGIKVTLVALVLALAVRSAHADSPAGSSGSDNLGLLNVMALGAHGDCTTPDDAVIQSAIDSTPSNSNDGNAPVYLPPTQGTSDGTTSKCYLLSKPLVLPHGGINFAGAGREQTFVEAQYYGPVLLGGTDTLKLASPLIGNTGNSIDLTSSSWLELSMLLRNKLNGHTAFSIEFEQNVPTSPSGSVILQSLYDWPYQQYKHINSVGAFDISYQPSNPHLDIQVTLSTSGLVITATANNTMTAGNHAVGVYYDGAHVWSCVDGSPSTPVAATGTWVQSKWESITLPDQNGNGVIAWPDGANNNGLNNNDSFNGKIDDLRISNIARVTSGTCPAVPTSKFTYDSNTDLLMTGLSCGDGAQYCLENGTGQYAVYAQTNSSPNQYWPNNNNGAWFPVLGTHGPFLAGLNVHDMVLGWHEWDQGAYILNSPWSRFERLKGGGGHNGLNLYYMDYESAVVDNFWEGASHNGYNAYELGYVTNTSNFDDNAAEQAFVCFNLESGQINFEGKSGHCLTDGETTVAWLDYGTSGTLIDPFIDSEVPTPFMTDIYFRSSSDIGPLILINGSFTTYGGVPFMIHDAFAGGHPIIAIGTAFGNFAENRPAGGIIQFPFGYPSQPDLLEHVMIADSGVPLSNEGGNAHVVMQGGKEAVATVLNGITAGRIRWSEPTSGGPKKEVVLNFQGYENTTARVQTITLPYGFAYTPSTYGSCPGNSFGVTTTTVDLPKSMSGTFTGQCIVAGE